MTNLLHDHIHIQPDTEQRGVRFHHHQEPATGDDKPKKKKKKRKKSKKRDQRQPDTHVVDRALPQAMTLPLPTDDPSSALATMCRQLEMVQRRWDSERVAILNSWANADRVHVRRATVLAALAAKRQAIAARERAALVHQLAILVQERQELLQRGEGTAQRRRRDTARSPSLPQESSFLDIIASGDEDEDDTKGGDSDSDMEPVVVDATVANVVVSDARARATSDASTAAQLRESLVRLLGVVDALIARNAFCEARMRPRRP